MIGGVTIGSPVWQLAGRWGVPLQVQETPRPMEAVEGKRLEQESREELAIRPVQRLHLHQLGEEVAREHRALVARVRRMEGARKYQAARVQPNIDEKRTR
ncbi:MAG TPA: hypothetical protein VFV52_00640 [Bacilli bacterium]|nr:hypothetical protein [Bacilli bacterium]